MAVKDIFYEGVGASTISFALTRGLEAAPASGVTGHFFESRRRRRWSVSYTAAWLLGWGLWPTI